MNCGAYDTINSGRPGYRPNCDVRINSDRSKNLYGIAAYIFARWQTDEIGWFEDRDKRVDLYGPFS